MRSIKLKRAHRKVSTNAVTARPMARLLWKSASNQTPFWMSSPRRSSASSMGATMKVTISGASGMPQMRKKKPTKPNTSITHTSVVLPW